MINSRRAARHKVSPFEAIVANSGAVRVGARMMNEDFFSKSHRDRYSRRLYQLPWKEAEGGRDTFICGLLMHEQPGLISLQRSQEPGSEPGAKPTEKCFYLARLSSLLKVRFF